MSIRRLKPNQEGKIFNCRGRYSPIGLDIGSGAVKMIQLELNRNRISIHNAALLKTPPQALSSGQIAEPGLISSLLGRQKKNSRWAGSKINLCLTPPAFYLRRIKMPPMKPAELRSAMDLAVEKYFPASGGNELVYDYCSAGNDQPGSIKENDYFLAAASLNCAGSYTAAAGRAGFRAAALEIAPFSLLRCLKINRPPDSNCPTEHEVELLADIGCSGTVFLIIENGCLQYYRHIKTGFIDFLSAATDKATSLRRRADMILFSSGSLSERGLLAPAEELANQIVQSLAYWNEQSNFLNSGARRLPPLWLCGGGTAIPGIPDYLGHITSLSTRILDPFAIINCRGADLSPAVKKRSFLFTAALGLAFRGWLR